MNLDSYRPVTISSGRRVENGVEFVNINNTVTIKTSEDKAQALLQIVHESNGVKSFDQIREVVHHQAFNELAETLIQYEVIIDTRKFFSLFHDYSRFPLTAAYNWHKKELEKKKADSVLPIPDTNFTKSLKARKSIRSFAKRSLALDQLEGLLGVVWPGKKTVPSAGGFYPLRVYVYLFKQVGDYNPGLYKLSTLEHKELPDQLVKAMIGTYMTEKATGIIFIVGDSRSVTYKYGNRGYRHLLLEAGHVAQNAYIYATEQNIGICEHGGFNDRELAKALELKYPDEAILTTLLFGRPSNKSYKEPFVDEEYILRTSLPVERLSTNVFTYNDYTMPYYASCAKYKRDNNQYSAFGIGSTLAEANLKALAEAGERLTSSFYRVDYFGKATNKCFVPEVVQWPEYQQANKLQPYDRKTRRDWVKGVSLTNFELYYVPADFVFYPVDTPMSWTANSSGVASHFDHNKATENALLELIERDALAVTWYSKISPSQITSLTKDVLYRTNKLKELGRKVWFFDITKDSIPVILCVITSNSYPLTTTGCTAAYNVHDAMKKSLDEAEFVLHSWCAVRKDPIHYTDVKGRTDHGVVNANTNLIENEYTSWLFSGRIKNNGYGEYSFEDLINKFEPIALDLGKIAGLYTVRVISNKLVPLTFGYGSEVCRHPRFDKLQLRYAWGGQPAYPHLLA